MNNTLQSIVPFGEPFPSVAAAVAALTQPQLDRLLSIARRRVERLVQSPQVQRLLSQCEPADFVHEAIMLVLVGEIEPGQGRHTHPRHLACPRSFFNFLQGIVHNLTDDERKAYDVVERETLRLEQEKIPQSVLGDCITFRR